MHKIIVDTLGVFCRLSAIFVFAGVAVCLFTPPVQAKVTLAEIFGDDMVLQRDRTINVWGTASPGECVTVQLSNNKKATVANSKGEWLLSLPPMHTGAACKLIVTGSNRITLERILIGDVWLCSGQSNMVIPVAQTDAAALDYSGVAELPLRMYYELIPSVKRKLNIQGSLWKVVQRPMVNNQQAVPFLFGRELASREPVPIGIVSCAAAGAPMETFLPAGSGCNNAFMPPGYTVGSNYKLMFQPQVKFAAKGLIWYQGESNLRNSGDYERLLEMFITRVRSDRHDMNFPVYLVQLPGFGGVSKDMKDCAWAEVREAQYLAAKRLKRVYLVVTVDTSKDAPLHPREKLQLAKRLSELVLSTEYGVAFDRNSPVFVHGHAAGNQYVCEFNKRLHVQSVSRDAKISGFEIAGRSKVYQPANAVVQGRIVKLSNSQIAHPMFSRYDWSDNPSGNLCDVNQLPLTPFRSEICR